jgi:hypothetical protein
LIDDYSKQRIPAQLQRKLNQAITFAKQGTPLFKVSSEYNGVDLEGIEEGREVTEVNIGEKYTSLVDEKGYKFLSDILDIRLEKAKYKGKIEKLLGQCSHSNIARALCEETRENPFYYHGIDCIHWLCSGDVALAMDLTHRIFDGGDVRRDRCSQVPPDIQHKVIQRFAHDEVRRIKYIVPDGERMFDIVCYLGLLARTFVMHKRSKREDRPGDPVCKTHIDIRVPALSELQASDSQLSRVYQMLVSRAILFSLETSRSRLKHSTERLQLRRIYLPAFKAPLKRDVPIKVDIVDDLKSLLSAPKVFCERELSKADIDPQQLLLSLGDAIVRPKEL